MKYPIRFVAACLLGALSSQNLEAAEPSWWTGTETRILKEATVAENYAPLNLGQLKLVATKAKIHLAQELANIGISGPGFSNISDMVAAFTPRVDQSETEKTAARGANYAPANLGQLKAVAKPFYEFLILIGYDTKQNLRNHGAGAWGFDYPWNTATPIAIEENYAPANLGQLKWVFCFDLAHDENLDGEPDWWGEDKDGDGMSNYYELVHQLQAIVSDGGGNFDGDGVINERDARPNNAAVGALSITIEAPLAGTLNL